MVNEPLPASAADTSADHPWPVRHLSPKIQDYVAKMAPVWVEGQALNVKRWKHMVFLTLRDPEADMSISATLPASEVDALGSPLEDGARVVLFAKPQWWTKNGTLQLAGKEIRAVGLGELLARIEKLRNELAAEGLFDDDRKRPLPFVPRRIGLVCANQGDAEHDVVVNATHRWPSAVFEIRRVTVQGAKCVPEVTAAVAELDAIEDIDVIVVARGGGSLEDLLPFSSETLVRALAMCETPLVSAIGHEKDSPLLDLVADLRASTPTDAGKRIVPDAAQEQAGIDYAREAMAGALERRVERELAGLESLLSRPVMAQPLLILEPLIAEVERARDGAGRALVSLLSVADAAVRELAASLRALSPQGTLDRGFAVVHGEDGAIVRDAARVAAGDQLHLRFAHGERDATAQ